MNATQPGDYYRKEERLSGWFIYVKVIDVLAKEYAVIVVDEEGDPVPGIPLKYLQKHAFIDQFEKVEKVNGVFHPAHAGL